MDNDKIKNIITVTIDKAILLSIVRSRLVAIRIAKHIHPKQKSPSNAHLANKYTLFLKGLQTRLVTIYKIPNIIIIPTIKFSYLEQKANKIANSNFFIQDKEQCNKPNKLVDLHLRTAT